MKPNLIGKIFWGTLQALSAFIAACCIAFIYLKDGHFLLFAPFVFATLTAVFNYERKKFGDELYKKEPRAIEFKKLKLEMWHSLAIVIGLGSLTAMFSKGLWLIGKLTNHQEITLADLVQLLLATGATTVSIIIASSLDRRITCIADEE